MEKRLETLFLAMLNIRKKEMHLIKVLHYGQQPLVEFLNLQEQVQNMELENMSKERLMIIMTRNSILLKL